MSDEEAEVAALRDRLAALKAEKAARSEALEAAREEAEETASNTAVQRRAVDAAAALCDSRQAALDGVAAERGKLLEEEGVLLEAAKATHGALLARLQENEQRMRRVHACIVRELEAAAAEVAASTDYGGSGGGAYMDGAHGGSGGDACQAEEAAMESVQHARRRLLCLRLAA